MTKTVYKKDLLFPELSYKIVGCAYEVFNEIGGGHKEKAYQNAMRMALTEKALNFTEQHYYPVLFRNSVVERGFFDFFIEEKILVELKSLGRFTKGDFDQVNNYLTNSGIKLALLITFGQDEVRIKRMVNFKEIHQAPLFQTEDKII